jgi:hypothetical protein
MCAVLSRKMDLCRTSVQFEVTYPTVSILANQNNATVSWAVCGTGFESLPSGQPTGRLQCPQTSIPSFTRHTNVPFRRSIVLCDGFDVILFCLYNRRPLRSLPFWTTRTGELAQSRSCLWVETKQQGIIIYLESDFFVRRSNDLWVHGIVVVAIFFRKRPLECETEIILSRA